ncbi:hypothetical protein J437_LFUL002829 [Ladona fulva]|uniref:DDE Tnp4 domain-containing protein n=1 Tax=Ladona fulva TaxID=123851 RepID=A0A8K0K6A6_LADFU|nr:hypothetical protein J437_LFUL002829 [Ladona fulva]
MEDQATLLFSSKHRPKHKRMMDNTLQIPAETIIKGTVDTITPFSFVGDEAFRLSENILRPYGGKILSEKKKILNYLLSRARRYIECRFGILANKWRILHCPLNVDIEFAIDIVKTCCLLHNFVRKRDDYQFEDAITTPDLQNFDRDNMSRGNQRALTIRDKIANYFVSKERELTWQYNILQR